MTNYEVSKGKDSLNEKQKERLLAYQTACEKKRKGEQK